MNFPNICEMGSDMIGERAVISARTKLWDRTYFTVFFFLDCTTFQSVRSLHNGRLPVRFF